MNYYKPVIVILLGLCLFAYVDFDVIAHNMDRYHFVHSYKKGAKVLGLGILKKDAAVKVRHVFMGTPAHQSGLKKNDIIVSINKKEIKEVNEVKDIVDAHSDDEKLSLIIKRDGTENFLTFEIIPKSIY